MAQMNTEHKYRTGQFKGNCFRQTKSTACVRGQDKFLGTNFMSLKREGR